MFTTVLIVINLLVVIALIVTILMQRSEGGALGMGGGGGGGGFFSGRGQANALTRATAILGGLYFLTTLALGILLGANSSDKSRLMRETPAQNQPAPVNGVKTDAPQDAAKPAGTPQTAPLEPAKPAVPRSE